MLSFSKQQHKTLANSGSVHTSVRPSKKKKKAVSFLSTNGVKECVLFYRQMREAAGRKAHELNEKPKRYRSFYT